MAGYKDMLEKTIHELSIAHVTHNSRAINELERQKDVLSLERQLVENLY